MSTTLLRTARYNWSCAQCHERIKRGTIYSDTYWRTHDGTFHHIRRHKGCEDILKKPTLLETIRNLLKEDGPFIMSNEKGEKRWICGLSYIPYCSTKSHKRDVFVVITDWEGKNVMFLKPQQIKYWLTDDCKYLTELTEG